MVVLIQLIDNICGDQTKGYRGCQRQASLPAFQRVQSMVQTYAKQNVIVSKPLKPVRSPRVAGQMARPAHQQRNEYPLIASGIFLIYLERAHGDGSNFDKEQ